MIYDVDKETDKIIKLRSQLGLELRSSSITLNDGASTSFIFTDVELNLVYHSVPVWNVVPVKTLKRFIAVDV